MTPYTVPLRKISVEDFVAFARSGSARLKLGSSARENLKRGERAVQTLLRSKAIVYGVNTGVGDLCDVVLPDGDIRKLQENIILSHACGSAPYLAPDVARGALLLTVNSLAKGFSGVTLGTVQKLVALFNAGVSPLLPKQGSLGASGDLIPLAHLGLLLLGKGSAYQRGRVKGASAILRALGLRPAAFQPKEALGLINGTEAVTAQAAHVAYGSRNLVDTATRATAVLFELFGASKTSIDPALHRLKPHWGQKTVAATLRRLLARSALCDRQKKKAQEAYVIRCAPQIDGAVLETIVHSEKIIEVELNSVTDNPLFFSRRGTVIWLSGGNFHAQHIAFTLDSLGIALTAFSKVLERRIERLLNSDLSGLPPFLAPEGGLHSGFMITQYLAASLVAENSVLAHPASIQSVSVSANQEDFVSMAMTAASKAERILENCERVLAVLLVAAAQAMDLFVQQGGHSHMHFSPASQGLYKKIRFPIQYLRHDRLLSADIDTATKLVRNGYFL